MGGIPVELVVFWIVVGAILGALINDQKGRSPVEGALVGALLGLIGVLILAVQSSHKSPPPVTVGPASPASFVGMTRSAVYRGATRDGAERSYHADARAAGLSGFVPISEDWSLALGEQVLTVNYRYDPSEVPRVMQALAATDDPAKR